MKSPSRSRREPVLEHGRRTIIDYDSPMVRRILEAAEHVFATMSFPGTAMEDIATLAGCNKATIYYHIGGKDKLYREILKRHFRRFADQLEAELDNDADPLEIIGKSIRLHARLFQENERSTRTIAHELAFGSPHVTSEIAGQFQRILNVTARALERAAAAGKVRPLDPNMVHVVMVSPLLIGAISHQFFAKLKPVPGARTPAKLGRPDDIGSFLADLVTTGLLAKR